jgi:hypothetical protein
VFFWDTQISPEPTTFRCQSIASRCLNVSFLSPFPEGGRLQKELAYVVDNLGAGSGSTAANLMQTPTETNANGNVLTSEALLAHLDVLKAATRVVVEMDDV